jgi:hypothetical protein
LHGWDIARTVPSRTSFCIESNQSPIPNP